MPSILHKTSSISHLAWSNSFARRGSVWPFSISTSPCATRLSFVLNRNCREDEGRSLGIALQEGIPNHLKRLRTKSSVVSVKEKALLKASPRQAQRRPAYRLGGIRCIGGTSLIRAFLRNVGDLYRMPRENPISYKRRGKVPMPVQESDHPIVVLKSL